jgi:hypothetical protein
MSSEDTLQRLKSANETLQKEAEKEREKYIQTVAEMRELQGDLEQVVDAYRQGQAELDDIRVGKATKCIYVFM